MTELLISRGDTVPRSFLKSYCTASKSKKNTELFNDLKSSKSDELILSNSIQSDIPVSDIYRGHSENLLDISDALSSPEEIFLDKSEVMTLPNRHRRKVTVYDKVDPEDSIKDIMSGNDFYRYVLFKKHYEKYLYLSQLYEETRNIAYYLEEKYNEIKMERDDILQQKNDLLKRLESNEGQLKEKEDEVFAQYERVVFLEDQCEKLMAEKEQILIKINVLEKERSEAFKLLTEQSRVSEINRRGLEEARQEAISYMNKIKTEKECLERENDRLKEVLNAEREGMKMYANLLQRKYLVNTTTSNEVSTYHSSTLSSQFQKAMRHIATCKVHKCSVCSYAKETFEISQRNKQDGKLFGCLQTPFLEIKNMIKPPPSPINNGGENLSEWFRPLTISHSTPPSECSSLSIPFAELAIAFMDDNSDCISHTEKGISVDKDAEENSSHIERLDSFKVFRSDSGFASNCPEYKSNTATPNEKLKSHSILNDDDCVKLTRTKWTASFRKLIKRIKK